MSSANTAESPTSPLECVPAGAVPTVDEKANEFIRPTVVLRVEKVDQSTDVFDLTVAGASEFCAGSGGLLIHNCDEPVKWDSPAQVWKEGVYPALRADIPGDRPRVFVTTTPKPIDILKEWSKRKDGFVSMVRGSTYDNAANLSADFIAEIRREYEGTSIGRQEIDGELLDDMDGPLFNQAWINSTRVDAAPEVMSHTVIGVDPCLTGAEDGDMMGVVAVARGLDDHMYVLEDASIKLTGGAAARHAWLTFARHKADVLVVEDNLGKQWLVKVLTDTYNEMRDEGMFPAHTSAPIKTVHSNHGKKLRAEPVALRYEQKRVHHVGPAEQFEKLEDEMVSWDPTSSKESPDRLDALVHAGRHLMAGEKKNVRFFSPHRIQLAGL
jgi:phage terminase large subunit-like protein